MRRLNRALPMPLLAFAAPALAHSGGAADHHAPPGWTLDPWIVAPLALAALLFARGWRRLHVRSGQGSGALRRRGLLYAAGLLVLAAALVSPLHEAGERSFAAHMFEHELLMLFGAPLLVLAEPLAVMLWAFPSTTRRALAAVVPVIAANRVGVEHGQTFYGTSFITDERGDILAELDREEEGVIVATLDLDRVRRHRAAFGFFRDRRPELYGRLVQDI